MRSGSIISVVIAVVLGAVAAFLAKGMIDARGIDAATVQATRTIVVAARPLGFGVSLTRENLVEVPWPASGVLEGMFGSIDELAKDGRRLTLTNLQRNEPVLTSKVTGPNQRATLSTQIEGGMRAVSVRVDEVRGVAGFILPGDHVDVVLTRGEAGTQEGTAYADILLQNAKVLAIDQVAHERQDKPTVARAVTLELNVEQAQQVILAQGIGRLSLILRQTGEADAGPARRVTSSDLGSNSAQKDRVAADFEKKLEDVRAAAEEASARRAAELEARFRQELALSRLASKPPPVAIVAPTGPPDPIVNVIRNGNKRDQYTVVVEQ